MTAEAVIKLEELNCKMDKRTVAYERVTYGELLAMPEGERRKYTWIRGTDYWIKREIIDQ